MTLLAGDPMAQLNGDEGFQRFIRKCVHYVDRMDGQTYTDWAIVRLRPKRGLEEVLVFDYLDNDHALILVGKRVGLGPWLPVGRRFFWPGKDDLMSLVN